jgi:G3E family GTPase
MPYFPSPDIGMFGRRQRYARSHRIPTTILRRADELPDDPAVVTVNDTFGANDLAPFGTCPCCTVRVGLQHMLHRLLAEHGQRRFSRVVIKSDEELGPILRTFVPERALGAWLYVDHHPPISADRPEGIRNFVLIEDIPLDWNAFSRFMTTLMALRGADLLQMKGALNVAGCRGPVVVEVLQHLAQQPVELQAWPGDDRASRLAFTTRGIEEQAVRDLLSAVSALVTSS